LQLHVLCGMLGLWPAAAVSPAAGILGLAYEALSRRKIAAFACFSAGNPIGFVFRSLLSVGAERLFDRRASFWIIAILYATLCCVSWLSLPSNQSDKKKLCWHTVREFDIFGVVLSILGLGFLCLSLT
jgi:predicted MFS family arabinose efflux permease